MSKPDTIAAVATASGRAAIGIVRLSGPEVPSIASKLIGKPLPPRRAVVAQFRGADGTVIDQGMALYFPGPASYTGEDVLELHGHGGVMLVRLVLERCLALGARVAEPGEFTRRAFLNGKLDLAQAESVIDLIDATTAQAARSAMRSLTGLFSQEIQSLIAGLVDLRARVEATLDFPEEDVEIVHRADAESRLTRLQRRLDAVLDAARQGRILREGVRIVLAGQPNVGKSSLLNRLAGEERAIVTEIPGTTRDTIREAIDIEGIPLHIVDTAGLRAAQDPVEALGIQRTWTAIKDADAVVLVIDATQGETDADREIAKQLPPARGRVLAMNKIDLVPRPAGMEQDGVNRRVWLSAKTGMGLDLLRRALLEAVGWRGDPEGLFLARARHLEALSRARDHLRGAAPLVEQPDLFAEELRLAHAALGAIVGEFTSDDLLGEIFARFCIGK